MMIAYKGLVVRQFLCCLEGARFFPIEVQSLSIPSSLHNPHKQFTGVNAGKAHGICAIIDKFCKTELSEPRYLY